MVALALMGGRVGCLSRACDPCPVLPGPEFWLQIVVIGSSAQAKGAECTFWGARHAANCLLVNNNGWPHTFNIFLAV